MLKKLKHGFTLVELVIVIAVIAVLAAVLIPTFITVIDNANNSADLQLVANMNTVLSTDLTADGTATAENLRKLLKDNGITDITTKNKDVAIIYDKTEKKFKRLNVKDTLKNGQIAFADENAAFLEANPYSAEEVFANSIVVSTGGNDFAEALYRLHNLSDDTNVGDIISKLSSNGYVMGKIASIIQTTAYVTTEGNVRQIALTKSGDSWAVGGEAINPTRVVFSESVETIELAKFADEKYSSAVIILPNTLKNVTCSVDNFKTSSGSSESSLLFAGNTDLLNQLEEGKITDHYIKDGNIEEAKEAVAELGAQVTRELFYVTSNAQKEFEYSKVSDAILAAKDSAVYSGKPRSVVITQNGYTIAEDITIPQNITLNIPYYHNENYAAGGSEYLVGEGIGSTKEDLTSRAEYGEYYLLAEKSIVDDDIPEIKENYAHDIKYKQFEITLTGNLTVEKGGKLQIGGVTSYPDQYYQGHTSGYYGQLLNNGAITVKAGGTVDTYGYIKGTGAVTAENGGSVYQPFIVTDYTGGSNTLNLYMGGQSPFLRYAMLNIQCPLKINYGGLLWAHCNLYTGAGYNRTDEVVIGYGARTEQTKGLITLEQNSSVDCSYKFEASKAIVDSAAGNNLKGDIGKTTVTINGNARTEALSLLGLVSTANVLFPVPFNFDFKIASGNFSVYNSYVILPGASVTVENGATLTVTKGATFYVMDYLVQNAIMSGDKKYPTADQLSGKYDTAGILTVNGGLEVLDGAKVGGVIRTEQAGATLVIGNADVSGAFNVGGTGAYTSNTSSYTFPLRVFDVDSVGMADYADGSNLKPANVPANSQYSGQDGTQNLSETTEYYAYKLYAEGDAESAFTAPGGTYVNKRGEYSITYSATCGFVQTDGFSKQKDDFKNNGYSNEISSFDIAEAAINAYYQLSPKARKIVSEEGFDIATYNQTKVTQLFKTYSAYSAAFAESGKQLDVALAVTAAWNKYQSLSQNVKSLIAEDASSKLDELKVLSKNTVLFTVSYSSADSNKYPTAIANKDASAAEKTVSLENYTQTVDGTTTVYFTADLAPAAVEMWGKVQNQTVVCQLGTTDPAGTLFYEVWKSFTGCKYEKQGNATKLLGTDNANLTFKLYSDIQLWQTDYFTWYSKEGVSMEDKENLDELFGNFDHSYCTTGELHAYTKGKSFSFKQNLQILPTQTVSIDLNGNTLRFLVNTNVHGTNGNHIYNQGTFSITNGTIDAENVERKGINDSVKGSFSIDSPYWFIDSQGTLTATKLTINIQSTKLGRTVLTGGIHSKYQQAVAFASIEESYGDATIEDVKLNGDGSSVGIVIDGGYATIKNNVDINAQIGIKISMTNTGKEEQMPERSVEIADSVVMGSQALLINSSGNTFITSITDSKFASNFTSSKALEIVANGTNKVEIGNITNCSFASAGTAIQSTGKSGNNVVIGTMEDCTITGDKLMYTRDTVDVYGMKLDYTTVNNLKNCTIVASAADDKLATAVYVGAGSSLNMIVDSNTNNWFGAFGKMVEGNAAQSSKLFDIKGETVTLNTSVTFDPAKNLSGAGATEFHGGYDCQKLLAE